MYQATSTVFPAFADPGKQTLNVLFKEDIFKHKFLYYKNCYYFEPKVVAIQFSEG